MMLSHWVRPTKPVVRETAAPGGTLHLAFFQKGDPQRAQEALRKFRALKIKPDPQDGGAAAVRELRDA